MLFKFILLILFMTTNGLSSIPCPLTWVPDTNGGFPDEGVPTESGDYVIRGRGGLIPGRLSPVNETGYIPSTTIEVKTYEVLVNNEHCSLIWVKIDTPGFDISSKIVVNAGGNFVSRGDIDGFILGGSAQSITQFQTVYDGKIISLSDNFEILTSTYPPMEVFLTEFSFNSVNFEEVEQQAEYHILGVEEIENSANLEVVHTINHEQTIQEHFDLGEDFHWLGIQKVSQALLMWFGSPIISAEFEVDTVESLLTRRDRSLAVQKKVTLTGNVSSSIQVCSYAVIVQDYPVPFSALGTFKAEGMTAQQVKQILEETGRKTILGSRGLSVMAKVTGNITGKFAIRVKSVAVPVESGQSPCVAAIGKKTSQFIF